MQMLIHYLGNCINQNLLNGFYFSSESYFQVVDIVELLKLYVR